MLLTTFALTLSPVLFQSPKIKKAVKLQRILVEEDSKAELRDRPMLGVRLDVGEPIVRAFMEGGPAAQSGLEAGDRIIKVGKKKVKDTEGFLEAIAKCEAGEEVKLRVLRDEERVDVKVVLTSAERMRKVKKGLDPSRHIAFANTEKGEYLVEVESDRIEEHVDFWESEDGSTKELNVHITGEEISPGRLQELMQEHGIELDLNGVDLSGGEVEIRVEVESDDETMFSGDSLLEVLNRPGDEDLEALENGQRRRKMQGQQRRGSGQMRGDEDDDRDQGRRMRQKEGRNQGQGRRMSENEGKDRDQGRRMRQKEDRNQGQGRRMRENEGKDRDQGRWMRQRGGRNQGQGRRMRENEVKDRDQGRRMRQREGRNQSPERWTREGQGGDRYEENHNGRHDDGRHDDRRHDGGRHDDGRHDNGHHDNGHHDDGRHDDGRHDNEHHDDGRHDNGHDDGHHDGDMREHMDSLGREFERRMEEHHQHGEEISRGFDDAMRQMEEQREERAQGLHEERERVIEELHRRIEEVSMQFEDHFRALEEGHGERMRQLQEERERRFEELRARGEEMSHQFRSRELEARSERGHD